MKRAADDFAVIRSKMDKTVYLAPVTKRQSPAFREGVMAALDMAAREGFIGSGYTFDRLLRLTLDE